MLQREYVPYFRRILGERLKKRPKRSKEKKKGKHRDKRGYRRAEKDKTHTGRSRRRRRKRRRKKRRRRSSNVSFSEENIFFICKMMREIAIITIITEASNNERSIL